MCRVAPLVGAWIEIYLFLLRTVRCTVTPLVGAWIEILLFYSSIGYKGVAPLVGAWIEIGRSSFEKHTAQCRSSRGSVD